MGNSVPLRSEPITKPSLNYLLTPQNLCDVPMITSFESPECYLDLCCSTMNMGKFCASSIRTNDHIRPKSSIVTRNFILWKPWILFGCVVLNNEFRKKFGLSLIRTTNTFWLKSLPIEISMNLPMLTCIIWILIFN